jgi:hypothetical protein
MSDTTRRDFAKAVAAVAALPFVPSELIAQTPPAKPSPLADAQTALLKAEFGQFLTDAELEAMRKDFQDSAPLLQKFRDVKLANSDEPDFTFSSLVKRW